MDKRTIPIALVLVVSAIVGASVLPSSTDESGLSQTITGINGTNSITISADPVNDTIMMTGYNENGIETCWMKMNISHPE